MYNHLNSDYCNRVNWIVWIVVCDIGGTPCYMHLSLQNGRTPLMVASGGGQVECVKLLLDRGAQANHQSEVSLIDVVCCHHQNPLCEEGILIIVICV